MVDEAVTNEVPIKNLNVVLAVNEKFLFLMEVHDGVIKDKKDEGYKPTHYTSLDFDLKFEVLRRQWKVIIFITKDELTPGEAYGIRVERGNGSFRI